MKVILICLDFLAVAASALPELETLRKKLGEAESQFKARDEECSWLQKVEGELNATVKQLTSSAAALKQEHEAELIRLVQIEETLRKERDDAVDGLEAAKTSQQQALLAAQGQVQDAHAALSEIDSQLGGKFSPAVSGLYSVSDSSFVFRPDALPCPRQCVGATHNRLPKRPSRRAAKPGEPTARRPPQAPLGAQTNTSQR